MRRTTVIRFLGIASIMSMVQGTMGEIFSIDLGESIRLGMMKIDTTTCSRSVVSSMESMDYLPCYIYIDGNGVKVGQCAVDSYGESPKNTIRSIRKIIGKGIESDEVKEYQRENPYLVIEKNERRPKTSVVFKLPGMENPLSTEDILLQLFMHIEEWMKKNIKGMVKKKTKNHNRHFCVLNVPVNYGTIQKNVIKNVLEFTDIVPLTIISDVIGYSMCYCLSFLGSESIATNLVKDFILLDVSSDMTVVSNVRIEGKVDDRALISVPRYKMEPYGINNIVQLVAKEALNRYYKMNVPKDIPHRSMTNLLIESKNMIISLLTKDSYTMTIHGFEKSKVLLQEWSIEDMNNIIKAGIERMVHLVKSLQNEVADGKSKPLLLVGGGSRLKLLQQDLKEVNANISYELNAVESVSLGSLMLLPNLLESMNSKWKYIWDDVDNKEKLVFKVGKKELTTLDMHKGNQGKRFSMEVEKKSRENVVGEWFSTVDVYLKEDQIESKYGELRPESTSYANNISKDIDCVAYHLKYRYMEGLPINSIQGQLVYNEKSEHTSMKTVYVTTTVNEPKPTAGTSESFTEPTKEGEAGLATPPITQEKDTTSVEEGDGKHKEKEARDNHKEEQEKGPSKTEDTLCPKETPAPPPAPVEEHIKEVVVSKLVPESYIIENKVHKAIKVKSVFVHVLSGVEKEEIMASKMRFVGQNEESMGRSRLLNEVNDLIIKVSEIIQIDSNTIKLIVNEEQVKTLKTLVDWNIEMFRKMNLKMLEEKKVYMEETVMPIKGLLKKRDHTVTQLESISKMKTGLTKQIGKWGSIKTEKGDLTQIIKDIENWIVNMRNYIDTHGIYEKDWEQHSKEISAKAEEISILTATLRKEYNMRQRQNPADEAESTAKPHEPTKPETKESKSQVEPKEKPVEPKEKPVEPKKKPVEPKEKPVELKEKPVEHEAMPLREPRTFEPSSEAEADRKHDHLKDLEEQLSMSDGPWDL